MSRVFARETALKIAVEGARWIIGAADNVDANVLRYITPVQQAQAGLIADLDLIANMIYGRATAHAATSG